MIPFAQVSVFGLGLMGASLAAALKASGYAGRVVGCSRRQDTLDTARARGWIDAGFESPARAAEGAELAVFCAPIESIPDQAAAAAPGLPAGAILTDVGSTKRWLCGRLDAVAAARGAVYVPSHPMCGSELQSIGAARPDLYHGATVAVCPPGGGQMPALEKVVAFWNALGARVLEIDAAAHDELAARISHLPHLAASLVAVVAARRGVGADLRRLVGPGFRDTTRIAAGPADVWLDIVRTNRDAILDELRDLESGAGALRAAVERGDWPAVRAVLENGAAARRDIVS